MAVTLRLQRHGSKNRPFYHVVAADRRKPRDCKFIEKVGYYDPSSEPSLVKFQPERMQYWYGKGAVLSNTVATLCAKTGLKLERNKTAVVKGKAKK